MKNKKLFAILTLVCFMMTLMPVAAFAATFNYQESYVYTSDDNASEKVQVKDGDANAAEANLGIKFDFNGATTNSVFVWFVKDGSNVPVLAVAAPTTQNKDTVTKDESTGIFHITGSIAEGDEYLFAFANSGKYSVYASAEDPNGVDEKTLSAKIANVKRFPNMSNSSQRQFEITSSSSSSNYAMRLTVPDSLDAIDGTAPVKANGLTAEKDIVVDVEGDKVTETERTYFYKDGVEFSVSGMDANNVVGGEYTAKFVDAAGSAVRGQNVTFDTNSSNLTVNKEKATTDTLGQVKFKLSASSEGTYKVYITAGSYEAILNVTIGATGAYDIKVAKAPTAPVDVNTEFDSTHNKIQFTFTDANGNAVKTEKAMKSGAVAAFNSDLNYVPTLDGKQLTVNGKTDVNCRPYVAIVSQPSASKLENEDLKLVESDNDYKANLYIDTNDELEEGSYEVKVVLDNGKYVTVKFEVKEFQTPVALNLEYKADSVELNSYVDIDTLEWVDANGVTKDCDNKVDLAANGYAVEQFYATSETTSAGVKIPAGRVYAKKDDKYIGSKITVVAVDDRYNLTAKAELVVSDEASELAFDTKTLAVDVNNKVGVAVVDSQGNKVALNRGADATEKISYVVLDKPEGSKVSVTTDGADNNILEEGTFVMNVTANKIGNVTIQAVARVTYKDEDQKEVVRYYTGTQIFAVGKDSVGQVVVMSIGSNEIIINDAKGTIDAAPMIQNDRTYVPFRALAEAFGAEVAYDEATQAVTAELNGVTVVMTIGSATYTVNGAEKTMDVAPFITGSRTMIPVRFAAEAFGIKVIPTYNPDGSTADILFNL